MVDRERHVRGFRAHVRDGRLGFQPTHIEISDLRRTTAGRALFPDRRGKSAEHQVAERSGYPVDRGEQGRS
jgi:hypothetical protein